MSAHIGHLYKKTDDASDILQLLHIRRQLDTSSANTLYLQLCTQNHNLENHLFSLSWLLEQQKFAEAKKYLDDLL